MDLTSPWAFLKRNQNKLFIIPLGLLIFAAGWQTGRVMSPYYAAHPIVFETTEPTDGSRGELEDLRAAGTQKTSPAPTHSPKVGESLGEVAGTTSETTGKFVGSVNSDLYHLPDCPSASRIKAENQIWFEDAVAAEAAGYKPSRGE